MGIYTIARGSDYDKKRQDFTEKREQEIKDALEDFKDKIIFIEMEYDKDSEDYANLCEDISYEIKTDMENKWYIESVDYIEVMVYDIAYSFTMHYNDREDGDYSPY